MNEGWPEGKEKERRHAERSYLAFYLRVYDGLGDRVIGHLVNLSTRGMMLLCDVPIPVNAEYKLRMRLPRELIEDGEIVFSAVSRWCKSDTNPDFFQVGFQLHEIPPTVRDDILALIDEFCAGD